MQKENNILKELINKLKEENQTLKEIQSKYALHQLYIDATNKDIRTSIERWQEIKAVIESFKAQYDEPEPVLKGKISIKVYHGWQKRQLTFAVKKTVEKLNIVEKEIYKYLRVYETNRKEEIIALLESGKVVSISCADDIRKYHDDLLEAGIKITLQEFIDACYQQSLISGKFKGQIGRDTVKNVYLELKNLS